MLNGLIKPDLGTITMRGRVGALIALGGQFDFDNTYRIA
jgi:ABC-type polysaccharide/polyol phosphate transport system ATPase subunit